MMLWEKIRYLHLLFNLSVCKFLLLNVFIVIGFQAWTRQVHPPRPCSDQAETHPCQEADGRHSLFHRPSRLPEAH